MAEHEHQSSKSRPMVSTVLEDGRIIEMIHRRDTHETAFLVSENGVVSEHRSIDLPHLGKVVPFSADNNLITHGVVLLPSQAVSYADEQELIAEVRSFIHRYADLSETFEEAASYYVLLSWVYDAFSEVPYLRLQGDFGSGKSRCLQTIGALCYKPMFVSGASTVSPIFRITDIFRGTLVIDESDFRYSDEKADIIKILNNGNAAGFPVLRSEATPTKEFNPRAFSVFCPKIVASRTLFDDPALESRCITEVMSGLPPRSDIPVSLPREFRSEATELRNKLLMYRFNSLSQARNIDTIRHSSIEPRVAQVFGPLLSVVQDAAAKKRMLDLARKKSGLLAAERGIGLEGQLLDVIADLKRDGTTLGMKEIAERFVSRFGSDFDRPVTPRWVGAQLRKRLSLIPVKIHGNYVLSESVNDALASLFKRYRIEDEAVDVGTSSSSLVS